MALLRYFQLKSQKQPLPDQNGDLSSRIYLKQPLPDQNGDLSSRIYLKQPLPDPNGDLSSRIYLKQPLRENTLHCFTCTNTNTWH